ncbi:MAG: beta-eliminating lyase-related protein [Paenibacillus sp.]|uniref:threonine aldolase family protein n=1 Tax=Paenibacillus sp. TaxID=58172 RepID=UPI00291231D1|nr:beta-eliminating lyase-related protein [Paenibacillus sp.]MDU4694331.1 beta-eliminating lyase-related protein [Paenibacillus sp.]
MYGKEGTTDKKTLKTAFDRTVYQVGGHGKRNIEVLKQAFAEIDGQLDSDMYGNGLTLEAFEAKMAGVLGKASAVFFPSGTMAQQIALRIWCDRKGTKRVAYHPLCHLEIHEEDGLKELHGIEPILLADKDRLISLEDVQGLPEGVACLLLELPQREIGGQLPPFEELAAISEYCREKGIRLHLDGARLFEVLPYYQKTAAEVCALFDSVYISFYKGIGGIAGAILAGEPEFTKESKVWKRRHGGDLISLYPYFLSADYYYEQRVGKMDVYYRQAQELSELYNRCHHLKTVPDVPVSNMFHVHADLPKDRLEYILIEVYRETGVGLTPSVKEKVDLGCSFEVTIGDRYGEVPKDRLQLTFELLDQKLRGESR